MSKKRLWIAVFALVSTSLFAQLPEGHGYTVLETGTEGGLQVYTLSNDEGLTFELVEKVPLDLVRIGLIDQMIVTITSLENIDVDSLRFVNREDGVDCYTGLSRFEYNGTDYLEFIPSGITFRFQDFLRYDMNIISKELRVRLDGQFFNEQRLMELVARVVARPAEFLSLQDPEFLMSQFLEYERRLNMLTDAVVYISSGNIFKLGSEIPVDQVASIMEWKRSNPALTVEEVMEMAKEEDRSFKKKDVQIIFMVYFNEFPE